MAIKDAFDQLDHRTDSLLDALDETLTNVFNRAQTRTILRLRAALEVDPTGHVRRTARNVRVVNSLPQTFWDSLQSEGYAGAVGGFLGGFEGGIPTLEGVLNTISEKEALEPFDFTKTEADYFTQIRLGTAMSLRESVERVSGQARRAAMFSVGGLPFEDAAAMITERLGVGLAEANTLAATGISTFYRTVAATGYGRIGEDMAKVGKALHFTYYGPNDKFTRPFCEHVLAQVKAGRTWTQGQIEAMDNGQLDDPFKTGGGYNCRHQWVVSLNANHT